MITVKRIYEKPEKTDGFRILVDRLWPRGVSKQKAKIKLWMKEIGPSNELRKWFSHDPKKWPGFKSKYKKELESRKDLIKEIKSIEKKEKKVTLLYAARDQEHNEAVLLKEIL